MPFQLKAPFNPAGDQPMAIKSLVLGLKQNLASQTLLGVTGSGKTFSIANVVAEIQKPTLVISHNKVLAAQLWEEFRAFFPKNEVHYFVSYYDYYQPEAYIPQTDTYIEKDSAINEELDRLRHATSQAVSTKRDVLVVASVSCIYNLGSPHEYRELSLNLTRGQKITAKKLALALVNLQYVRNDLDPSRGNFRLRGDKIEIYPPTGKEIFILELGKNTIKHIGSEKPEFRFNPRGGTKKSLGLDSLRVFPAKFWVSPASSIALALNNIEAELSERLKELKKEGKILEAERLKQRTNFDLAMIRETGYCHGIENYSRHLEFRAPGEAPYTLLEYFNEAYGKNGWLCIIDESHMTIPQIRGMVYGDLSRKNLLVDYGFRLPSARDNRPLTFKEFSEKVGPIIFTSATPGNYELEKSEFIPESGGGNNVAKTKHGVIEQIIRPTGLLDPAIEIRPTRGQIEDLLKEIKKRSEKNQRTLVLTITKRLSEELAAFMTEGGIKVDWLHSEVKTLERPARLANLRSGEVDAIVGINLLREGLDLPEVSLVAILDADKEGFLRNYPTLIQMIGRASRNVDGHIIMYADNITQSMRDAIHETKRRRQLQNEYNKSHHIIPRSIEKPLVKSGLTDKNDGEKEFEKIDSSWRGDPLIIEQLKKEMAEHSKNLRFEEAARVRDLIKRLTIK
ncbi:MAG: excinuclease ABC subunit B [Candidatus Terrybacteria bacterium RIFCSPLOWO2_01_FULL_44_24]|uniref:UvrABC system protein B n=1 Tax=Candidatus Terrybacteria bacterium RIFCSPHIGHO2_01_FULL_43_35 TaxID=1802361 RepID=A0A1G2PE83_9BACT|nr:MAG: excinuclease ABC subunit B [Candidatus Terrybacteria bacterium RIFCSPHIGHO2_01_FULL_43_35]OHA50883.1 MAG: excinuclease ABC subunit B [Candidatus Terrybacteria bacterium RIFCSPLOWO2_01_FULL_44_24]